MLRTQFHMISKNHNTTICIQRRIYLFPWNEIFGCGDELGLLFPEFLYPAPDLYVGPDTANLKTRTYCVNRSNWLSMTQSIHFDNDDLEIRSYDSSYSVQDLIHHD